MVVVANNGNKKATGIVGLTAKTTAKIADPEPTRLNGPRKNREASTMQRQVPTQQVSGE